MTSNFLRTDVTAVKLFKKYILAGIGSKLNVLDQESFELILKLDTLEGQKIYGIIPHKCETNILIYGGKQLTVASFAEIEDGQAVSATPVTCHDWLHSGDWVNETEVAVLTAHNVVQVWNTENWCLKTKYESKYNSILYSGLLFVLSDDILVFSGTVYSEVIIQTVKRGPLHFLKGHNGVIFSITYDPVKQLIVTTSDDRSVRIWEIQNDNNFDHRFSNYWQNVKIVCTHKMYGHTARVMRSHICDECILSVGEDSGICFWNFNGTLLRRITSHQNSSIWSLHADLKHLVTGGGDGAIILHPMALKHNYKNSEIITIDSIDTPKKIEFTARKNLVIVNESNDLVYYDLTSKMSTKHDLNHESTYKMLGISSCKQIIAVSDMKGNLDVFIENCKGEAEVHKIINTKLNIGKVLSMHWAGDRHLVFCSDSGIINIIAAKEKDIEIISTYVLPPCKERWLTAAAMSSDKKLIIVGDRCGNIHIYDKDVKNPIKTFNKVQGRYGATSINIRNKEIITTGRDGSIKYFLIRDDEIKYASCKHVDFQWVEKFIDKNDKYICGFQERIFVVYNTDNTKLIESNCGGGHRSWDAVRTIDKINDAYEEIIKLVYVKNSDIYLNTFLMNRIVSQNVINGTHSNAINCLKTIHKNDLQTTYFISGGEDTTLRVSKLDNNGNFKDDQIFKHLSSIRALKIANLGHNRVLLVSAGGRAQICAKILNFDVEKTKVVAEEIVDFQIKGTDKERKCDQNWKSVTVDFDPETRVMDLEVIREDNGFKIFAACSDAHIRVLHLNKDSKMVLVSNIKYHNTCILKTHTVNINNFDIIITCTTRGEVAFWNGDTNIFSTRTNKSGINCISSAPVSETTFVIATGGDDNTIHVLLLQFQQTSIKLIAKWKSSTLHSSQITGIVFVDDVLISTSIDQRITLLRWCVGDDIKCDFLSQSFSHVADIHGIDLVEYNRDSVSVCVFGKGMEVVTIPVMRA